MAIILDQDFQGGNLGKYTVSGDIVFVENDLRGCQGDWFYWAFRVRGAAGKTLRFDFGDKKRVGYFGAAVSHDLKTWQWGGKADGMYAFTYTFGPEENEAYFCHDLYYSPQRFFSFAQRQHWDVDILCQTEKGRALPCIQLGTGKKQILLASRHHCCESTGTYVLEGILEEIGGKLPPDYSLLAIPFVDYDGVMEGDQGKNRAPYDHNRDYHDQPVYAACREIMARAKKQDTVMAFDFHSPHHCALTSAGPGPYCDHVFMIRNNPGMRDQQVLFSRLFREEAARDPAAFSYTGEYDFDYDTLWNSDNKPTFGCYFAHFPGVQLAFCLETAYNGVENDRVTQESLLALGRSFGRAMLRYMASSV